MDAKDEKLRNLHNFSLYYQGYRQGIMDWQEAIEHTKTWKWKKVYLKAIYKFLISNIGNCEKYRLNGGECNFKDHKQDKNGNLTECTAYIE